ncbi:MAG: hypothetical protein OES57_16565 [Acidimicrobiia bacterium]|nr:hypothetical protein [Acidimicrobiia bacterium]
MTVRIHSPAGSIDRPHTEPAPAPATLEGVSIGILDNTKPNAGVLLGAAADELCRRTGARLVHTDTKNAALPAKDRVLNGMVREVQVVLTGSAD